MAANGLQSVHLAVGRHCRKDRRRVRRPADVAHRVAQVEREHRLRHKQPVKAQADCISASYCSQPAMHTGGNYDAALVQVVETAIGADMQPIDKIKPYSLSRGPIASTLPFGIRVLTQTCGLSESQSLTVQSAPADRNARCTWLLQASE